MKHTDKMELARLLAVGLGLAAPWLTAQTSSEQAPEELRLVQEPRTSQEPAAAKPLIPLAEPPQSLIGEDGKVELDLVDPFQRGRLRTVEADEPEGLSATTLGEISEEFRILAIVIPDDPSRQPMALIRLQNESTPQLVTKDDLVQIKRRPEGARQPLRRAPAPNASGEGTSFEESALAALESYSFYLHIKEIHPTYIEAYQKKSPNETIILRW